MSLRREAWRLVLLFALVAAGGCGGSDSMVEATGNVTLDGRPLPTGTIMFVPADGKAQTAGGEIKDGRYAARVPRGMMKVSVSSPKVVGKKKIYPTPESPEMPITVELIPARYNEKTELQFDVTADTKQKDFALKSE